VGAGGLGVDGEHDIDMSGRLFFKH
jgi:hypothetical protein